MRPRYKLQSQRKPRYFLASLALHALLVGFFIYFYSNFSSSRSQEQAYREKTTDLPISTINPEKPIAREDSVQESLIEQPPPTPPEPDREERITELLEPLEKEVLLEPPPRVSLPESNHLTLSEPRQESPGRQENSPVLEANRSHEREEASPLTEEPPSTQPEENILRAQLTTGVEQHEPVDQLGKVIPVNKRGVKRLYYFTEVINMYGRTIIHRWEYEGRVIAKVPLSIDSYQWRTYSSKALTPAMIGRWQVVVTDEQGKPLHTDNFVYKEP